MGIPSYYRHLIQKYEHLIKKDHSFEGKKHLYFDFNALIHPVVQMVLSDNKHSDRPIRRYNEIEELIIQEIINYTRMIINKINPDLTYISIDGVVPRFKMVQQRIRRFKSVLERKREQRNREKDDEYDEKLENLFDRNCISPGTMFMKNLSTEIRNFISGSNLNIVFSDESDFGEGEHRIMRYIRNNWSNKGIQHIIYSLDADIIMLSMLSYDETIYLLREKQYFEKKNESHKYKDEEFHYLNIEKLKDGIWSEKKRQIQEYISQRDFIFDYVFLCFFMGNDFIPHLKELSIHKGGIDLLVKTYMTKLEEVKERLYDPEKVRFNKDFLIKILKDLSIQENRLVLRNSNKRDKEVIGYGQDKRWKEKHNEYFFRSNSKSKIKFICNEYWKSIVWTMRYYQTNQPPAWRFYFRFRESPLLSDLVKVMEEDDRDVNDYHFKRDSPYTPDQSLMMILPRESMFLVKEKYRGLPDKELLEYFPNYYKLEKVNKPIPWMYTPILRNIDDRKIEKYIK